MSDNGYYSSSAGQLRMWLTRALWEMQGLYPYVRTKSCPKYVREHIEHMEIIIRTAAHNDLLDRPDRTTADLPAEEL